MYKIDAVSQQTLDEHYDKYAPLIKPLMQGLLNGTLCVDVKLGRTTVIRVKCKVRLNSPTYVFLVKYQKDKHLRKLLCGSWQDTLAIIDEIVGILPNHSWRHKMTKQRFEANEYQKDGTDVDGAIFVDDFYTIMHWLFVEQMYENAFNKLAHIKTLQLKICPYCGRQHINIAEYPEYNVSKPPIDHFLPKSVYPFLAISFLNLIPCCTTCNELANKGIYDPLFPALGLQNPYLFEKDNVKFQGVFNIANEQDTDGYDVDMVFEPPTLSEGYAKQLKLLPFYKAEKLRIQTMYMQFRTATPILKEYLHNHGIADDFLNNIPCFVLGHPLDGKASQREFYKFNEDLMTQLLANMG